MVIIHLIPVFKVRLSQYVFIYLCAIYRVVACRACEYVDLGKEVDRHLKDRHKGMLKKDRRQITASTGQIPRLIQGGRRFKTV
jgi:hypothetical protein